MLTTIKKGNAQQDHSDPTTVAVAKADHKDSKTAVVPVSSNLIIDIYINADGSFYDINDACMRAIIDSFDMGDIQLNNGFFLSGAQVVLWLKDLHSVQLNLKCEYSTINLNYYNKDVVLTKCAMESVVKKLHAGVVTQNPRNF